MCGISGRVNFDRTPVDRAMLVRMTRRLVHRGPDGTGIHIDGHVGFGHNRLAIRDLSARGNQPMCDPERAWCVTYNGEIYNDLVLRDQITRVRPTRFRSTCDAEIVGPAYVAWGTEAFKRFEGMFAIALWDAEKQRLILARDPVGIKPLYYSWDGRSITFASEIKALLAAVSTQRINMSHLHSFMAQGYVGPTDTLLDSVKAVPPGSYLVAEADKLYIESYWTPKRTNEITDATEAAIQFRNTWDTVIGDMLVSDVPVGVLLSGGIDSSLVASALKGTNIPTFSATFPQEDFDETVQAAEVARHFQLQNLIIGSESASDAERRFLDVVHHFDGNCADSSGLAFHAVCEAAREHVPVVLTGDGADEFFGGYQTYRASRVARCLAGIVPKRLGAGIGEYLLSAAGTGRKRIPFSQKLGRFMAGVSMGEGIEHPQWRRYLYPETGRRIFGREMREVAESIDPLVGYARAVRGATGTLVDRCMLADQTFYLPADLLVKSDAMSMANGVEVRVPFLDRRIMELAGKLDSKLLTPVTGPDKKILRRALLDVGISRSIAYGKKKGFNVPIAELLRTDMRAVGDRFLARGADSLAPYFLPEQISAIWKEHVERQVDHAYVLWTLLTLAVWRDSSGII